MGFQNFVDGGFIGKVGNVVGQRWKDKRMIRTYVKGTQPNTPAQLASRELFRIANKLAQQAMNINGHTGIWDTSQKPEYAQRVGLAYKRLRAGIPPEQAIPLYPEGYNPPQDLAITSIAINPAGNTVTIQLTDFPTSAPVSCKLDINSPLLLKGQTYQTLQVTPTIQGRNIVIDTTALPDVINYFRLGIVALNFTFFDADGKELVDTKVQRNYAIPGVLYDFNEKSELQTSNEPVLIRRKIADSKTQVKIQKPATKDPIMFFAGISDFTLEDAGKKENLIQTANSAGLEQTFIKDVPVQTATGQIKSYTQDIYLMAGIGTGATVYKQSSTRNLYADVSIQNVTLDKQATTLTLELNQIDPLLIGSATAKAKTIRDRLTLSVDEYTLTPAANLGTLVFRDISTYTLKILESLKFVSFTMDALDPFGDTDTGINFNFEYWQDNGFKTWNYAIAPEIKKIVAFETYQDGTDTVVTKITPLPGNSQNLYGEADCAGMFYEGHATFTMDWQSVNGPFPATISSKMKPGDYDCIGFAQSESLLMDKDDPNRHPILSSNYAFSLEIQNIATEDATGKVTLYLSPNIRSKPTSAEVSLYSPLSLEGSNFKEIPVSMQVEGDNLVTTLGAESLAYKAFKLGLCAITTSFSDAEGSMGKNLLTRRNYAIAGKLYDFNKDSPIVENTDVVLVRRKVSANSTLLRVQKPTALNGFVAFAATSSLTFDGAGNTEDVLSTAKAPASQTSYDLPLSVNVADGAIKNYSAQAFYLSEGGRKAAVIRRATTRNLFATVNIQAIENTGDYGTITLKTNQIDGNLLGSAQAMAKALQGQSTTNVETKTITPATSLGDMQFTGWSTGAQKALSECFFIAFKITATDPFGETDTGVTFNLSFWDDIGWKTWNYDVAPKTDGAISISAELDSQEDVLFTLEEYPETGKAYWGEFYGYAILTPGNVRAQSNFERVEGSLPWSINAQVAPQAWDGIDESGGAFYLMVKDDPNRSPIVG